jgi:hypothetical protein
MEFDHLTDMDRKPDEYALRGEGRSLTLFNLE